MVKGAWIFMTECDYVWMAPVRAPGNAYDKGVAGEGRAGGGEGAPLAMPTTREWQVRAGPGGMGARPWQEGRGSWFSST